MSEKKQVVIIAASPKPPGQAVSDRLAEIAAETLRGDALDARVVNAREALHKRQADAAFQAMAEADALIIVFPLYIFCLPGLTMRFLQQYQQFAASLPHKRQAAVYSVINCGFPEPEINEDASRVVRRFAQAIGGRYGFGILIGSGPMVTIKAPPVAKLLWQYRDTLARIGAEIIRGDCAPAASVNLRVHFPRFLYFLMGNLGWRRWIRQNGGTKKDLYARPYET